MKKIFTILGIVSVATFANAQIVINEAYGGGGNSGSTYKNDFIELINSGTATVTLSGATLQYASATGTFNQYHTLPSITLTPGQTYLIQEAAGTGGTTSISPDFTPSAIINFDGSTNTSVGFAMAAANFKVVLASNDTQVTGPTNANVLDFVGVGTANMYEGSGAAPAASNSTSVSRTNGVDTNNNTADFTAGTPTPQNSSTLAVTDITKAKSVLVKNTVAKETITFANDSDVQIVNAAGQVVKAAKVNAGTELNVSSLSKGVYFVTGTVNGQKVSQKIVKQ
ncbi:MAG: lamin tail domain-containing protein [Bergeyella sp.]